MTDEYDGYEQYRDGDDIANEEHERWDAELHEPNDMNDGGPRGGWERSPLGDHLAEALGDWIKTHPGVTVEDALRALDQIRASLVDFRETHGEQLT